MDSCVLVEMEAMLDKPGNGRNQEEIKTSIYKVPYLISNGNVKAYQPRVVSFGPYHYGKNRLASMEAHKKHTLSNYIQKSGRTMKEIFDSVKEMAPKLMASYDSLDPKWPNNIDSFVKLMILDGCFMLEVLIVYQHKNYDSDYYSKNDPIFSPHGEFNVMHLIRADMLILENQLPMLLLLELYKKYIHNNVKPGIEDLNADILLFLNNFNSVSMENFPEMGECSHVLELYHKSLLVYRYDKRVKAAYERTSQFAERTSQFLKKTKRGENDVGHNVVCPATELHDSGVHFKKSKIKSLMDITFDSKTGVLELPKFIIDDSTESMYLNLIAFERCHVPAGNNITSLVAFMDCIINDHQDIKLLCSKRIIRNFLKTDKEAADLFNRMSRDLFIGMNYYFFMIYRDLRVYNIVRKDKWKTHWNKWGANLTQTYFRSPWAFISVIAATLGLSLAVVQTIFTILD